MDPNVLFMSVHAGMRLALVITVAIGATGGLLAWRERPEPGALPLAFLFAGQCWWSATLFFQISATGIGPKTFWYNVSWLGVVVIPVAWLYFSLEYTGYTKYVQPRYIALLSVIPAVTAVLALTDPYHGLLYGQSTLVDKGEYTSIVRARNVWFWVIAGYTYLLGLAGVIPLLGFVTSDVNVFRGQSLTLLLGIVVPWVTNALFVFKALPTGGIDPTPIAFSVSGVTFLGAVTRFQLLGTSPSPIRSARNSVFEQMQQGALVLDRQRNVVDVNRTATDILERSPSELLGKPVERTLPELADVIENSAEQSVISPGEREHLFDVSVEDLEDAHGRTTGRVVIFHDITSLMQQQQRLEVLNRMFRHNIRTSVQVIMSNIDYLAENNSESKADAARQRAQEILETSERIRKALDLFERGRNQSEPAGCSVLLREALDTVREDYPDVTVDCDLPSDDVYVDLVLEDVFWNLIENAARHNTNPNPALRVDVETSDERVRVSITDNGPGIDDEELALLEQRTETALEHGTGIGIAIAIWGTELVGGDVTFEDNHPTGTTVTVDVPRLSAPTAGSPRAEGQQRAIRASDGGQYEE